MKTEKSKSDTLITISPNTWHTSKFIQQTKATWSMSPTSNIKWYQQVTCLWLITLMIFDWLLWWFLLTFEWVFGACLLLKYLIFINIFFLFYSYVEKPENYPVIGTKWVFRNKLDKNGIVRNKTVLLYPLLKRNISLPAVVVHRFYGWSINYLTMASFLIAYLLSVIILVP